VRKTLVVGLLSIGMLVGCSEVVTEEVSTTPVSETKEEAPKAVTTTLGAGKHTVGEDIPAGEYTVSTKEAMGNLFIGIEVNEILGTDTTMAVNNVSVELEEGQEIQISGLNEVLFEAK
jgi:hypothetical protein